MSDETRTRICPLCGEPIEIPEGEDVPEHATVRHEPGTCPTKPRAAQYRYVGTFTVTRYAMPAEEEIPAEGTDGILDPVELAMVSAEMTAKDFASCGAELATKVGNKLNDVLANASLIDLG